MFPDPIKMERSINAEPAGQTSHLSSTTSNTISAMPSSHPIQQLEHVIMKAEAADPPGRARDLLRPIQGTIKVREQHYEDCLKEKDAQVLALKLELFKVKMSAKEMDEKFLAVRGELRDTKGDFRSLKSQAREGEKRIGELEAEKLAWLEDSCDKVKELEAARADLQLEVDSLRDTVNRQSSEMFDLRVKGIAQRGEIHFLMKNIVALQEDLELKRAAADWLAQNGPSLQDDFHRMQDEITELKEKGAEMAKMMARGAREWHIDRVSHGVAEPEVIGASEGEALTNTGRSNRGDSVKLRNVELGNEMRVRSWASKEHRRATNSPQAKRSRSGQVKRGFEVSDPYVGMDIGEEVKIVQYRRKRMSLFQYVA